MAGVERQVVGACPLNCPDACSWVVTLDGDGQPIKLRGNAEHPFTRNGLCTKVNPYLEHAARPDRITTALRRVGAKGEGRFEPISLDEAFAEIAERLQHVIDTVGAEGIWPFTGTGTVGFLQSIGAGKRLFNHLGASRHEVTICSVAGHVGMSYTTGSASGMDPEHLAKSAAVVLWGANTLTSNQHLFPFAREAQRGGAPLVVIDPARTRTADRADLHIAPMPGTDGALALGVMAELVARGAIDHAYLETRCAGWSDFRDDVLAGWSAARAAEACGLGVGEVEELVSIFAASRPVGIKMSMGMQRHAGGGQAARVISCIPAVTGDYGRLGGGLSYSTGPEYRFDTFAFNRPDLRPGPMRSLAMTRLGEGLLELDDPPVNALVVINANPVVSNPDQGRTRAGLSRDDLFTVVVEQVHTPTTAYADIVLPATTQLEHIDVMDSYAHLYVNWNEPVIEPPGDCMSNTEVFRRLAAAMSLDEPALYASDVELAEALLDSDSPQLDGITVESLRERGWQRLNVGSTYQPFVDTFATVSGKFEFVSRRAEIDGHGRLPHYVPPAESAPAAGADDTLALVAAANHYLLNSSFGDSAHHQRRGVPELVMHPEDAAARSLADGDVVTVENDRGSFEAAVVVSDRARRGVVLTSKGLWPDASGRSVNATVREDDADMGRGAVYHDNRVSIRRP